MFLMVVMLLLVMAFPVTSNAAVKISKKSVTLIKGQTTVLKITGTKNKVAWSSNKKSVAVVSNKGKVTAKKKGSATITAKVGKKKYTCKVTVQTPSISQKTVTLTKGDSAKLVLNGTNQKVTWKSSNTGVAEVSSTGNVAAKKAGSATITATVLKKKYTCKVTVKDSNVPVELFYLSQYYTSIKEGKSTKIETDIYPQNATNKTVVWSSENTSVATVDSDGNVKGISAGQTIIKAVCDSKVETCIVTVTQDFDVQDALKHLSYESYRINDGVITIVKNNYKYNIYLKIDCLFYNSSGEIIDTTSSSCEPLEPGKECALFNMAPVDENYDYVDFSKYNVVLDPEPSDYIGNASKIALTLNFGLDNVMVTVKNEGIANNNTEVSIVFYKKGIPVGYDCNYADVENVGKIDYIKFDFPYGSNGNLIIPDSYKLFVNESYSLN